jgi:hypothetical protein
MIHRQRGKALDSKLMTEIDFPEADFWPGTIVGISAPQARIVVAIIATHFQPRSSGIL